MHSVWPGDYRQYSIYMVAPVSITLSCSLSSCPFWILLPQGVYTVQSPMWNPRRALCKCGRSNFVWLLMVQNQRCAPISVYCPLWRETMALFAPYSICLRSSDTDFDKLHSHLKILLWVCPHKSIDSPSRQARST